MDIDRYSNKKAYHHYCEFESKWEEDDKSLESSDLFTNDMRTVFLYSIYAYFWSIFPSRIRYLR
jgi:hypothetical protein